MPRTEEPRTRTVPSRFDGQELTFLYILDFDEALWVSSLHPMRSAAGWYAGRCYLEGGDEDLQFPYCRISEYYATREEAQAYIDAMPQE